MKLKKTLIRKIKNKEKKSLKEQGQALIFMGFMILSFFSFFTFVVHTGLLVNARINLQNAADLAAYAGAAVQARQLNTISYLNYEMRRQYKKFLFRYYVVGTIAEVSFTQTADDARRVYSPTGQPGDDLEVPAVCLIFNSNDNYCQLTSTPPIAIPNANPFDSIGSALVNQLETFEQIRKANCGKIAQTNQTALLLWLFSTSPSVNDLDFGNDPQIQQAAGAIRGLAQGLGLYPRNLILSLRVRTLENYVNLNPFRNLDLDGAEDLKGSADPAKNERPIQAFFSAFNTLGNHSFDAGSIQMDELLPQGDDGANLIELVEHKNNFEAYFVEYNIADPNDPNSACQSFPSALPVRELPVGFSKSPSALTYYAVRLKARANLMFSPFGPVEMKAYAAAMPFGSRIGPLAEFYGDNPFVELGKGVPANQPIGDCCEGLPNLRVQSSSEALAQGWHMGRVQKSMRGALQQAGSTGGQQQGGLSINGQNLAEAYIAAMAPNPSERGRYNIINDIGHNSQDFEHISTGDPFFRPFGRDGEAGNGVTTIWAPVVDLDSGQDPGSAISEAIQSIQGLPQQIIAPLSTGIQDYVQVLQGAGGEDGEGLRTLPIRDPMNKYNGGSRSPAGGTDQNATAIFDATGDENLDTPNIKTSWSNVRHNDLKQRGRTGYSVKFVSFSSLLNGGSNPPDGSNPFENTFNAIFDFDEEAKADIPFLKH